MHKKWRNPELNEQLLPSEEGLCLMECLNLFYSNRKLGWVLTWVRTGYLHNACCNTHCHITVGSTDSIQTGGKSAICRSDSVTLGKRRKWFCLIKLMYQLLCYSSVSTLICDFFCHPSPPFCPLLHPIPFHLIPSHSIPSNPIPSHHIPFHQQEGRVQV